MEVTLHLHRGDCTTASVEQAGLARWFIVHPEGLKSAIAIDIPLELVADAEAFAESINQYCRRRPVAV